MAGAVAAPAAGAAAATAAATAATSVAKSIFGAVWENKTVSAIALAAAAYGLHYFTSNARGESRFGNMVGDKASDLFNWLSTDGKDGFMKFGEKGIDFVWDKVKENPLIAGGIGLGGLVYAMSDKENKLRNLVLSGLLVGSLVFGYSYLTKGNFNLASSGANVDAPRSSYVQRMTTPLVIPPLNLPKSLTAAPAARTLEHE